MDIEERKIGNRTLYYDKKRQNRKCVAFAITSFLILLIACVIGLFL